MVHVIRHNKSACNSLYFIRGLSEQNISLLTQNYFYGYMNIQCNIHYINYIYKNSHDMVFWLCWLNTHIKIIINIKKV